MFFNNLEEVKVLVRGGGVRGVGAWAIVRAGMGKDCIVASEGHKRRSDAANTSSPVALGFGLEEKAEGSRL